jgi:holo-[acyl-carrier protein] synthase
MSLRVGIDLVSVDAVRDSIRTHGARYLERIYTAAELRDCEGAAGTSPEPERLAARFAAKEAALKALRPSNEAIPWRSIEVVRHPSGWVELELSGRAAASAVAQGLRDFAVSLTHEAGYASAVVVASS